MNETLSILESLVKKLEIGKYLDFHDTNATSSNYSARIHYTDGAIHASCPVNFDFSATMKQAMLDMFYPVGSIYMSMKDTSPATLFGGTWEQIKNKFIYCAENNPGAEGGSESHIHSTGNCTLNVNQIPSHSHTVNINTTQAGSHFHYLQWTDPNAPYGYKVVNGKCDDGNYNLSIGIAPASSNSDLETQMRTLTAPNHYHTVNGNTDSTGSTWAHNHGNTGSASNMPPYIQAYCWHRTA